MRPICKCFTLATQSKGEKHKLFIYKLLLLKQTHIYKVSALIKVNIHIISKFTINVSYLRFVLYYWHLLVEMCTVKYLNQKIKSFFIYLFF